MQVLITGGAGFIGCNLALALIRAGHRVVIVDDLSRHGSKDNLQHLLGVREAGGRVTFVPDDVRNADAIESVTAEHRPSAVVHLAAQVAVTTSLTDPSTDFDINARGTLNVLEATRRHAPEARLVFASTNKVYGRLEGTRAERGDTRWTMPDHPNGVAETMPLRPETPYGCSKAAADTYVSDYARTYGLRTTVLRLSCVYGPRQNGTSEQGWVSWFINAALSGKYITVYGDGLQVRDLLYVDDLVDALSGLIESDRGVGETFNLGGGPRFAMSVWAEFGEVLARAIGRRIGIRSGPERPGDQKVYISDIRRAARVLSWKPSTPPYEGVQAMVEHARRTS